MQIEINKENPGEWKKQLDEIDNFLRESRKEFSRKYRYCCGCKDYRRLGSVYEDDYHGITVFRCCGCNAILEAFR